MLFISKLYYLLFLIIISYPGFALSSNLQKLTKNQQSFLNAYSAIKSNDRSLISSYKAELKNYSLYPYLNYYDIIFHFDTIPQSQIDLFISTYPEFALTPRLIRHYLLFLGKEKKYQTFLKYYKSSEHTTTSLKCYAYMSMLTSNKNLEILKKAKLLWQNQLTISKHCNPLDQYLKKHKNISGSMLWHRVIKNMKKGRIRKAKQLSLNLSKADRKSLSFWIKVYKQPYLIKNKKMPSYVSPIIRKHIFKQGINRYAYSKPKQALVLLAQKQYQYGLNLKEFNKIKQQITLRLAYKFHPEAKNYLKKIDKAANNKNVINWRLQTAIRDSDWLNFLDLFAILPGELQQNNRWLYWKARALFELDKTNQAKEIYRKLSLQRDYYGFLSADQLNQKYQFNNRQYNISQNTTPELIKKYPELLAIKELIAIDWQDNLKRTWYTLLNKADKKDITAIANHMFELEQHPLAIQTIAKVKMWDNLKLRFPTPYKLFVDESAKNNSLDPAWIYGVIRKESAFSPRISSSAGAIGLMQLLPSTAKFIARKHGIHKKQKIKLKEPNSNIKIGSAYLNYLSKKYNGNRILATAAYNAGPNRVDRWIPNDRVLMADQWIDSIPFLETRNYVKSVLEFSTIFKNILSHRYDKLEVFMQPIGQNLSKKKALGTTRAFK